MVAMQGSHILCGCACVVIMALSLLLLLRTLEQLTKE